MDEGGLINAVAERRNVADSNFLLVKDAEVIFEDIDKIYTTKFETRAIELLDKYSVRYIYISEASRDKYKIESPAYVNERCFPLVYDEDVRIYKVRCHVKNG